MTHCYPRQTGGSSLQFIFSRITASPSPIHLLSALLGWSVNEDPFFEGQLNGLRDRSLGFHNAHQLTVARAQHSPWAEAGDLQAGRRCPATVLAAVSWRSAQDRRGSAKATARLPTGCPEASGRLPQAPQLTTRHSVVTSARHWFEVHFL